MRLRILLIAAILAWGSHAKAQQPGEVGRYEKQGLKLVLTTLEDTCENGTRKAFGVLQGRPIEGCWFIHGDRVYVELDEDPVQRAVWWLKSEFELNGV